MTRTAQKKARTGIDRFADIAAREEETTQKALELKKTKFKGETEKALARVRAQAEIQMNKDRLRMEYAQKKLEFDFKLQLQAVQAAQRPQMRGQSYPTLQTFPGHQFSPFSGHQNSSEFSFQGNDYNSYSSQTPSQASGSRWESNIASSSSSTQAPYSGWEPSPGPTDDTSKSESLSFTKQLNSNNSDLF